MQQISPAFLILANVLVTGTMLAFFRRAGLSYDNFTLGIFILAGVYGLFHAWTQSTGRGNFQIRRKLRPLLFLRQVVARFLVWLGILYSAWLFFHFEPYYAGEAFRINRVLFSQLINIYWWAGIPYFIITMMIRDSRREDFYDPAVRITLLIKHLLLAPGGSRLRQVLRKQYNRKVMLNLVMRMYFIPVMIVQVYSNLYFSLQLAENQFQNYTFMVFAFWVGYFLFLVDVSNACVSYVIESRWLENRTRSIDLTLGGWIVCFMCYAPLNMITDELFVFAPTVASNQSIDLIVNNINFLYAVKIIELLFLSAHVCCNISLGTSVANITLKKLQTRGPYSLVRHPGTTTKLALWLMQAVFYRRFWSLRFIFGYLGWALIYYLRTVTEERHLRHFAEYREYVKKVKYRFFPGLF